MLTRHIVSLKRIALSLTVAGLATPAGVAGAQSTDCHPPPAPTFTVQLPKLNNPPDEEGQGWDRPPVWEHHPAATSDSITVPNGRPIYALIVSGFGQNKYLDEIMVYRFARHLQAQGAYVHYSWWNNLLAPYMERPLHHLQSEPGGIADGGILNFSSAEQAGHKAVPAEDYQFVADAKLFLAAIREHNPSAMIIVVGHSMGGGAVVHLGSQSDVLIDILAPIDPVGNRNYPWAGIHPARSDFNWTRWRVTRKNFLGYRSATLDFPDCVPTGPWLADFTDVSSAFPCQGAYFVHQAPRVRFASNVINLHHRYQKEYLFPFDYADDYTFLHTRPPGGTTSQSAITATPAFCGPGQRCPDPGGWPLNGSREAACCTSGAMGVGWANDGHGEIVGHRGPTPPIPLGVRMRTSPQCGEDCPSLDWPAREVSDSGAWIDPNRAQRVALLKALESLSSDENWPHRPKNASLCIVSSGLINRFNIMNKPPVADAGGDQFFECTGQGETQVLLNGAASSDPDGDVLDYTWTWDSGSASGPVAMVSLPMGTHCITLEVRDPSGHIDRDTVAVTIQDTTPPELIVALSPRLLWPPNHSMKAINAVVQAQDNCGGPVEVKLLSIVSNQPDNAQGNGDGNTVNDIQGADFNTLDLQFKLRAERAAVLGDRHYTVTYQATDDAGNQAQVSVDVIVPKNANSLHNWQQALGL